MLAAWGVAKVAGTNLARGFVVFKLIVLSLDVSIMALIVAASRDRSDPKRAAGFAWQARLMVERNRPGGPTRSPTTNRS